jgi:hypothetical protein
MIQSVDNSSNQASPAAKPSSATSNGGASFATALSAAQKTQATGGMAASSDTSGASGTIVGDLKTDLTPPKGESWGPVPGHTDYADILSGPRDGFFVSLTGPRKGQAFVIVHKDGKTFHVYGQGKNKQSVPVAPNPADFKPAKGETWKPVDKHHDFKQIHGGKRNDQFVNLSGNARTGQTFKIAHHDGKTWHVYANGDQVAVGGHNKHAATQPTTPTTPQTTNGSPTGPG